MKKKKLIKLLVKLIRKPTTVEKQAKAISEWLKGSSIHTSPNISAGTGMEENPNYCSDICDSCRQILDRRWSNAIMFTS